MINTTERQPSLPTQDPPPLPTPDRLSASTSLGSRSKVVRVADVFAGIGGFHLAFDQAGAKTVFACESEPLARLTYEVNFRPSSPQLFDRHHFADDIRTLDLGAVPFFDVLTAGFPCQPFSVAGKQQGFDDERGTLFFALARLIAARRPEAFFLENVQGLAFHDHGRTLAEMKRVLTDVLGYSFHTKVVRACDFGVPQLRPRLFMVGFRNPQTPFSFPDPIPLTTTLSDVLGGTTEREIAYTLTASRAGRRYGRGSQAGAYLVDGQPIHLSVDQAATLQGFPDDFVFPVSMTRAMHQLGNALAVPAAAATAQAIINALRPASTGNPA